MQEPAMKYHAPTKQFTVSLSDIEQASRLFRYSIKHIRSMANLDPRGFEHHGPMEPPHFAESAILRAAFMLGIDLGSTNYGEIDVSNDN